MWKWIGESGGLPGIARRDYSDDEFEAISLEYDAGFPGEEAGILGRSELWQHAAGPLPITSESTDRIRAIASAAGIDPLDEDGNEIGRDGLIDAIEAKGAGRRRQPANEPPAVEAKEGD